MARECKIEVLEMEQKQGESSAKNFIVLITEGEEGRETEHLREVACICDKSRRAHMSSLCDEHVGCNWQTVTIYATESIDFTKRSRCNCYRGYPHVDVGQGWFVSSRRIDPCIAPTSKYLARNRLAYKFAHYRSRYCSINVEMQESSRKKLRAISLNLIIDVIDIFDEIVVRNAVHAKQMKWEKRQEKRTITREKSLACTRTM